MPNDSYYRHVRREIAPLLPARMERVLEVGCGAGDTLRWLKESRPGLFTTGVEYNPKMRTALENNVDEVWIGPIETVMPNLGTYDTILCLDVLEHLLDSDAALASLVSRLDPGGCIIISLPNISHLAVSVPLLLRRSFPYADAGLLDRTHLRFFTESSILGFVAKAGLFIEEGGLSGMQSRRWRHANQLTLGLFKHHMTKQYVFRARAGSGVGRPSWRVL